LKAGVAEAVRCALDRNNGSMIGHGKGLDDRIGEGMGIGKGEVVSGWRVRRSIPQAKVEALQRSGDRAPLGIDDALQAGL
jgi:hypothetical protein